MGQPKQSDQAISDWEPHLALGITGHRETNPTFAANRVGVESALKSLFKTIDSLCANASASASTTRLHSLLAEGTDQIAAGLATGLGWDVIAPLPFGSDLNLAINARPSSAKDAAELCQGKPARDPEVERRAARIRTVAQAAHLFELADRDDQIRTLFEASLADPSDENSAQAFGALCSENVANAGQIMIERVDLLIAVWDGKDNHHRGGTGHTVAAALSLGTPVLLVDPSIPDSWSVYSRPEELGHPAGNPMDRLQSIVASTFAGENKELKRLLQSSPVRNPNRWFAFYRFIEARFGTAPAKTKAAPSGDDTVAVDTSMIGLIEAASKSGPTDPHLEQRLRNRLLPTFDLTDAISTALSDAYRSSMCYNFVLAALAVITGLLYLPLKLDASKWVFASIELLLLGGIIAITAIGKRRAWHRRWFETRRTAEYLRHSPAMLMLGVSRPIGRWPRGGEREWPEQYARHLLRGIGLPQITLDRTYLQRVITHVIVPHVTSQRDYHRFKADRLTRVHHGLDKLAQACFFLGVLSVTVYLALKLGAVTQLTPSSWPDATSKLFTFLGVAFPTLGANIAGIRFFSDTERFAAISRVAAQRLDEIAGRLDLLLTSQPSALTYRATADLVVALDEAVIDEIEGWQSVFGSKHLDLPA